MAGEESKSGWLGFCDEGLSNDCFSASSVFTNSDRNGMATGEKCDRIMTVEYSQLVLLPFGARLCVSSIRHKGGAHCRIAAFCLDFCVNFELAIF